MNDLRQHAKTDDALIRYYKLLAQREPNEEDRLMAIRWGIRKHMIDDRIEKLEERRARE